MIHHRQNEVICVHVYPSNHIRYTMKVIDLSGNCNEWLVLLFFYITRCFSQFRVQYEPIWTKSPFRLNSYHIWSKFVILEMKHADGRTDGQTDKRTWSTPTLYVRLHAPIWKT